MSDESPPEWIQKLSDEASDRLSKVEKDIPKKSFFGLFHPHSKPSLERRRNIANDASRQAEETFKFVRDNVSENNLPDKFKLDFAKGQAEYSSRSRDVEEKITSRSNTFLENLGEKVGQISPSIIKGFLGKAGR